MRAPVLWTKKNWGARKLSWKNSSEKKKSVNQKDAIKSSSKKKSSLPN